MSTTSETARPIIVDDTALAHLIRTETVPVLVDFYADWCGPCHMMAPILEQFARQNAGKVIVAKLDTDRSPASANQYGIRGIPTMVLFHGGREVNRQVGLAPITLLEKMIKTAA